MATIPFFTGGRVCLGFVSLMTMFGPYIADWNETHVKNPNWPPHARFHNGQTMSMGLSLGALTLYLLSKRNSNYPQYLWLATITASMYWITGLSAILYPGTRFVDPEFLKPGDFTAPQLPMFSGFFVIAWIGYFLETNRLAKVKAA